MAVSFQKYVNNTLGLYCEYSYSQSISGNYSDVTVSVWCGYYTIEVLPRAGTVTVNGTSKSFTSPAHTNYTGGQNHFKLTQQTIRVYHNSDGTKKNVNISVSWNSQINYAGTWYETLTASTTFNLPTIPRASSFTLSNTGADVGMTITANISRANTSFTHTVEFYINSSYYEDFDSQKFATSKTFTIPREWLKAMPSSKSATAHCRVTTYNENTQIGSAVTKDFTVYVPDDIKPTIGEITLSPVAINGKSKLVQGKNKLVLSLNHCYPGEGSEMSAFYWDGEGVPSPSVPKDRSITIGPITKSGTLTYSARVTDLRTSSDIVAKTITCYAYSNPSFSAFNVYRCDKSGSAKSDGDHIRCIFTPKYSSVDGTNSASVKIFGTGKTTTISSTTSGTRVDTLISLDGNTTSTYKVYATISDSYGGSSTSSTITIFGEAKVLNISKDGTGFAIGKASEGKNLFECKHNAQFYGTATGPSGFATSSDRRVKTNIQDIDIDIIDKLHPVQYELNKLPDGKIHYGFIAQDVNEVLSNIDKDPNAIGLIGSIPDGDDIQYTLSYTEFIPLLTKKCQELQKENNEMRAEIAELRDMILKISSS